MKRIPLLLETFQFPFNPFSHGKLKNTIFENPIIPQTLNINNQRTTIGKAINLDIIRKLIKHPLKKSFGKGNVYPHRFRDTTVRM